MKLLNMDRVLCLSPHPDDVEYSMSGLIKKYKDTHFDVLCLSVGGLFDPTSSVKRWEETEKFWGCFQAPNTTIKYGGIDDKVYISNNPDMIISHLESKTILKSHGGIFIPTDNDDHFEHRIIAKVGRALIRHKLLNLIEYKTPSTRLSWEPNYFCHISQNELDHKIKSLHCIKSQTDSLYFSDKVIRAFHQNYTVMKKNIEFVEQFKVVFLHD